MPVLVTGGAGYVGSHACKALSRSGYQPVTVDNLVHGHEWAVKWGPMERGDVADADFLLEVVRKYRPVAVLHFAAFAYVGESVAAPGKYYQNNVIGALRLLETCRASGINAFVFSSSCATYGVPETVPIAETQLQSPINPYGESKLMVEKFLRDYSSAYGLRSASLRYFNAAGADPEGDIGEMHEPETHLVPLVLKATTGERERITIFGNDYATPDGTCIRDYVHVTDLADAHVRALKYLLAGGETTALNLGTGKGHSVLQVVEAAERVTGNPVWRTEGPRRAGDPPELVADPARAKRVLGWQPGLQTIDEIVATAWAWHRKHPGSLS